MSNLESKKSAFRCPVDPKNASGILKIGRKRLHVTVVDTSLEGFTVTIPKQYTKCVRHGCTWILTLKGERCIVSPEWMFNAAGGDAQAGLRRIEDVTPEPKVKHCLWSAGLRNCNGTSDLTAFSLGGMVMLLFALLTLPGVGDDLGTAPKIRSMIHGTFQMVSRTLR